jgi:hypothetical protein
MEIAVNNKCDNLVWVGINVYGPVQHDQEAELFLLELQDKLGHVHRVAFLALLGRYFNFIRYVYAYENSSSHVDIHTKQKF